MRLTLAALVSRENYFEEWQRSIHSLDIPREDTEVCLLVDGTEEFKDKVENAFQDWRKVTVEHSGEEPVEHSDLMGRRNRIAALMNRLAEQAGFSTYTMIVEDDTLVPRNAFNRLHQRMARGVGYVSGVEVGRWGIPYIGAWKMDDIVHPNKIWSLEYKEAGYQEIDAGGLYCCLVRTRDFKEATFETKDFGPDFHFVHDLRKYGYKAYCDWSTKCVHLSGSARLEVTPKVVSVPFQLRKGKMTQGKISYRSV